MDKLVIEGGVALKGEVRISGAKNAALPILCAAILSDEPLRVSNVPHLRDVTTMLGLLAQMGIAVSVDDKLGIELNAQALDNPAAPYELVKTMRASVLVLGPLLARWVPLTLRSESSLARASLLEAHYLGPLHVVASGKRRWRRPRQPPGPPVTRAVRARASCESG